MSFNSHYNQAMDTNPPRRHRMSHLRSCTVCVSDKYKVHRDVVLLAVNLKAEYAEKHLPDDVEIELFSGRLKHLKDNGLSDNF